MEIFIAIEDLNANRSPKSAPEVKKLVTKRE